MTDIARPTGTIAGLVSDLVQFIRDYRAHRRTLRIWRRTRPEQQLAFFISLCATQPEVREAFRKALRVKGVPETEPKDDRRVLPASEFSRVMQNRRRG